MGGKTYAWFIFIWVVLMLMDGIGAGLSNAVKTSHMNIALSLDVLKMYTVIGISIPLPNLSWFSSVYHLAIWDFWFLDNTVGNLFRIIVGLPVMGLLIWGLVTTIGPLLISSASAMLSFVSNSISGISSFFKIGT